MTEFRLDDRMTLAEATRQYQCTLEAARAALTHAPAESTDPHEAIWRTIGEDLEAAHTVMRDAWRAWAAERLA